MWDFQPKAVQDRGQLAFLNGVGADPLWRGVACPSRVRVPGMESTEKREGSRRMTLIETPVGSLRYGYTLSANGNTWFLVEHPLKCEEDYKVQTWIEEHTIVEADRESVLSHYAGEGREGVTLGMLIPRLKSAFQSLIEVLAGTEALNYALVDYPDTVRRLWDVMVARNLESVRLAACSEHKYFISWEDSSTQNYSPTQYESFIASEIRQWCALLADADKRYFQHACGHVRGLLDSMTTSGIGGIESLTQPPTGNIPLADARKRIGPKMTIIGGIEPTVLLDSSLDSLAPYVERVIADGKNGSFILANADSCPPGVGVDKFKLIASIAQSCT